MATGISSSVGRPHRRAGSASRRADGQAVCARGLFAFLVLALLVLAWHRLELSCVLATVGSLGLA